MANEPVERPGSLLQSVARMIDAAVNDGAGYESLIPVLSLICLVSILGHGQQRAAQASPAPGANANPLHKLLGDLTKGEGGGLGPEALVSLLPLLNSPQVKSKLNPATIGTIMGLLNNMGDKGEQSKQESAKQDKTADKGDKGEEKRVVPPTAATMTSTEAPDDRQIPPETGEGDKKGPGRYLNWKSTF
ncbi:hypothetical protein [Anaeroselena agilis]|uniref:DUF937 domain-containing protein n=1 Tax=Anaeroselena agilis TaxID=3063788 RepID=A0ABU3NX51_9FIRM|nr:hypothetical protein [Selenomonadales bacterium 4137-cl]